MLAFIPLNAMGEIEKHFSDKEAIRNFLNGLPEASRRDLFAVMEEQKYENLFYRPNMTPKDRMNLQKVLVMLKRNGMDTPKHIQMLERVVYLPHAILIADVPFARKNRKAIPNGKDIFLHGNDILFLPSVLPSQDAEMQKQGMRIPHPSEIRKAMRALPADTKDKKRRDERSGYVGCNILGILLGIPLSKCNTTDPMVQNVKAGSFYANANPRKNGASWIYVCRDWEDEGSLYSVRTRDGGHCIRPVYIQK